MDEMKPVLYTAHCPNGPTHCCEEHARQIRGLFHFMGCHIGFTAAPDGAECANCANEAKAAGSAIGGVSAKRSQGIGSKGIDDGK